MDLLTLLIVLIVVGVALYLLNLVPMQPQFKTAATVIVIAFVIIWLLRMLLGGTANFHLGR